ncbi:unnamed protein product [Phytophthora fragariaefolia]|uniref:Unnamed protein product n=1 Tax=Phytophthora fragariaefolia TaxID=1490495 RepID=A0A9W7CNS8_9STRA|nr:unnamed protein product [Phytophthora fragariaefolia]
MADRIRNLARRTDEGSDENDDDSGKSLLDMIQFGLHRLMEEAASEDEDALMKPLEEEYIQHILARKTTFAPCEGSSGSDEEVLSSLKSDKLLESGGDFCEENMYYFEGEDYTKVMTTKAKDAELLQKLCTEAATTAKRQTLAARKRYEQDDEDGDEEDEEQTAENEAEQARKRVERRQKALERKLAQWEANKYTSAAIDANSTGTSSDQLTTRDSSGRLFYKSGDASHPPINYLRLRPYIIVHCVDNSGIWCSRGFFRTLSALSRAIQQQYEAAGRNGDLKLGSAHLIRLPSTAINGSHPPVDGYVCLLVVQGFAGKKKQRVGNGQLIRQGKSSTFRLNALEMALQALALRALELGATVHLPRIGYGTPNFNWYAVERLLARKLRDVGVEATIYYYSARQRT